MHHDNSGCLKIDKFDLERRTRKLAQSLSNDDETTRPSLPYYWGVSSFSEIEFLVERDSATQVKVVI